MTAPLGFAARFPLPYSAVIFASRRRPTVDADGYAALANRMGALAEVQPGYLGIESTRDADGFGITVSYWRSLDAISRWRAVVEHEAARGQGRAVFYSHYELRVAKVERAYGFDADTDDSTHDPGA